MNGRRQIAKMVSDILSERKDYPLIPRGMTEHIVKGIERPGVRRAAYRTGSLLSYLSSRNMRLEVCHEDAGYRKVITTNSELHEAIRFCLDYYGITEGDLGRDGVEYRYARGTDASISIDRCWDVFEKLNMKVMIIDDESD